MCHYFLLLLFRPHSRSGTRCHAGQYAMVVNSFARQLQLAVLLKIPAHLPTCASEHMCGSRGERFIPQLRRGPFGSVPHGAAVPVPTTRFAASPITQPVAFGCWRSRRYHQLVALRATLACCSHRPCWRTDPHSADWCERSCQLAASAPVTAQFLVAALARACPP